MAFSAEFIAFAAEVKPQIQAAVADIQKLHDILVSADPDIDAAREAMTDLRTHFASLAEKVAIPEPGDEVPPPA